MRLAGVDIGSNTSLLLIVEKSSKGFEVLSDKIYFTRLAENLTKDSQISESALFRIDQAFKSMKEQLQTWQVQNAIVVATSAVRQAENKKRIFDLGKKYGLDVKVISSKREAELTFIGSLFGLGHEDISKPLVIDIGGGSTEFVSSKKIYGIEIGSVSLTERFLSHQAPSPSQLKSLNEFILSCFSGSLLKFLKKDYDTLIFTAGTPTTLACLEKQTEDFNKVHGLILTKKQVEHWLNKLLKMSVEERKKVPFLPEHRADVIVAGLSLLNQILSVSKKSSFVVSATGVRYGLILEKFS